MAGFFTAEGVGKKFADRWALGPLDFTLAAGECLAVVGPSGSGKSTLLKLVAGLLPLDAGRFACLGASWDDLPAWRRRVAWVTPQGFFFPQWTIERNLAFRLKEAARERANPGWLGALGYAASDLFGCVSPHAGSSRQGGGAAASRAERRFRTHPPVPWGDETVADAPPPAAPSGAVSASSRSQARKILAAWGLEAWAERRPHELSAGERQRAALASVSAFRRRLVLLDEPLGHVDVVDRPAWARTWRELQKRRRQTTLYVTHDPAEAALVADRVLLLRQGKLEQLASFAELSRSPASTWASEWATRPNQNMLSARRVETPAGPRWEAGGAVQHALPPPREGERFAQLRFAPEVALAFATEATSLSPSSAEPEAGLASAPRGEPSGPGGGLAVRGIVLDVRAGGGRSILLPTEEFLRAAAVSPPLLPGTAAGVWIPAGALHWSVRGG